MQALYAQQDNKSSPRQPPLVVEQNFKMSLQKEDLTLYRTKSVEWNYFGDRKDNVDQKQVLCRVGLEIVAPKKGNTTHLFSHLISHLKALYNECKAISECHAKQKQKLFWMPLPVLHHTRAIPKGSMQMNSATKSSKSLYNDPFLFSFFFLILQYV